MPDSLPDAIRKERYRRGMSQRELARAIGTSTATVSNAETGHRDVGPQVLRDMAEALQLTPANFPELANSPPPSIPTATSPANDSGSSRTSESPADPTLAGAETPTQGTGPARQSRPNSAQQTQRQTNQQRTPAGSTPKQNPRRGANPQPDARTTPSRPGRNTGSKPTAPAQQGPSRGRPARAATTAGGTTRTPISKEEKEEKKKLERMLQELLESGFIPGAIEVEPGTWKMPENPRTAQQVAGDSANTGTIASESHDPQADRLELHHGMAILEFSKPETGHLHLALVDHDIHGPRPQAALVMSHDHNPDKIIRFLKVTDREDADIPPGSYRIDSRGETSWEMRWIQFTQGTGWVNLLQMSETTPQDPEHWAEPTLTIMEPSRPPGTPVTLRVSQKEPGHMVMEAHSLDGTHQLTILNDTVGPEPLEAPTEMRPQAEYVLTILAHHPWNISFRETTPTSEEQQYPEPKNLQTGTSPN